ncbi:MAG: hypothetical protein MI974_13540 [Chitinophagales bacterium]|nr:hypothetical protein [Chitinophagales bacterium]
MRWKFWKRKPRKKDLKEELKGKGSYYLKQLEAKRKKKRWYLIFKTYKYSEEDLMKSPEMERVDTVIKELNELIRTKIKGENIDLNEYDKIRATIKELEDEKNSEIEEIEGRVPLRGDRWRNRFGQLKEFFK